MKASLSLFTSLASFATLSIFAIAKPVKAEIFNAFPYCIVQGIESGQLALRHRPQGKAHAGLNNGNKVIAFGGTVGSDPNDQRSWMSVKVVDGPNPRVEGKQGVVDDSYLNCNWDNPVQWQGRKDQLPNKVKPNQWVN